MRIRILTFEGSDERLVCTVGTVTIHIPYAGSIERKKACNKIRNQPDHQQIFGFLYEADYHDLWQKE